MSQHRPAKPEAPILDPVIRKMLDHLAAEGGPPVYSLTPTEARNSIVRIQSWSVPAPESRIRDLNVEFAGQALRLHIVYPPKLAGRYPVVMYFHGGGWVLGDATTHDRLVRELAVGADTAVVFVDYDRAPEHRYPVALEQAYAATCYVAENVRLGCGRRSAPRARCQPPWPKSRRVRRPMCRWRGRRPQVGGRKR